MARPTPPFFALRELSWLIGFGFGSVLSAQAQSQSPTATLREEVVSGSRTAQDPDELPISIDVIGTRAVLLQGGHIQADGPPLQVLDTDTVRRIWQVDVHPVRDADGCPQLLMA